MKQIVGLIIFFAFFQGAFSQTHSCGTIGNGQNLSPVELIETGSANRSDRTGITYVELKVHIGSLPGLGGDAISKVEVQRAIDSTNLRFLSTGIQFLVCGDIQIIDDNNIYYLWDPVSLNPYHEYGYVNVTIPSFQGMIPGAAGLAFPDHVVLGASYVNTSVLDHELGHVLGLAHTHDTIYGSGAELVDGSNCLTAGDFICDTPADPQLNLPGMLASLGCTYIGTATDGNGQPYAPMVNNIMSYSYFECRDAFTQGQADYMHNVLDNAKSYLHRSVTPVEFNLPSQFCSYDAPHNLTAIPSGGSFTGPQVIGSTLDFQLFPSDAYWVNYTPLSGPDPVTDYIGQYSMNLTTLDTAETVWQSFTTAETGTIFAIDFNIQNLAANNFDFNIYAGVGTTGTLVYSTTLNLPAGITTDWVSFPVSPGLSSTPGVVYTISISCPAPGFAFYRSNFSVLFGDCYVNGQSEFWNQDIAFREWVNGVPPCQDCFKYYNVHAAPVGTITNLASVYCAGEDTLALTGDQPIGEFYIDGLSSPQLNPSDLAAGFHDVLYVSNSMGCLDSSAAAFEIVNGQASFLSLPDTTYTSVSPFVVSASATGGTITIDNIPSTLFDPAALGIGMHHLYYVDSTQHDTLTYTDQFCINPNAAMGLGMWYKDLLMDSLYFQSFQSNQSGLLQGIYIKYLVLSDTLKYEMKLFKGTGIGGAEILADTIFIDGWNDFTYPNIFSNSQSVYMEDDSIYTFSLKRILDDHPATFGQLVTFTNDYYPAGISNLIPDQSAQDFYFREVITQYTGCDIIAEDSVFVISDLGNETYENADFVLVYPNPTTDQITVKIVQNELDFSVRLYNTTGQLVFYSSSNDGEMIVDFSDWAKGVYFAEIQTEFQVSTCKIIKE